MAHVPALNNGRGYTFVELMVVIALVGIFFFFAIPRIAPDIPSEDFRKAINWFALNVPRLKRLAVSEQKIVLLTIDRNTGMLIISDATSSPEERFALPDTVHIGEIVSFGRPLPESGPVMIRFLPDGISDFMSIRLSDDDGREADIQIEPFLYAAKISENRPR
ncbi:MAG: prepilin-type N-terminal cleavage/methylation domain-containing protein [Pseudomonadota bacterium]